MRAIEKLKILLKESLMPVGYRAFTKAPALPYILYFLEDTDPFVADNRVYSVMENYVVELYSKKKSLSKEDAIEALFDREKIIYEKHENYIDTEKMFLITYNIQLERGA